MRETKPTGAFASAIRVLCTCTIMGALTTAALEAQDYRVLLDASGEVRDDAYDHLRRAVFGSDRVYEGIDGRHLKTLMNEVVAISRRSRDDGNRFWGRISGTEYEALTADWSKRKFRALGLEDIRTQEFELGRQWFPIDWSLSDGVAQIPIEQRDESEVLEISGQDGAGAGRRVRIAPAGCRAANYAFDVTPARLVSGLITERGVCEASAEGLAGLFPERVQG